MDCDSHFHDRVDHIHRIGHILRLIDKYFVNPVLPDLVDDVRLHAKYGNVPKLLRSAFPVHHVYTGYLVVMNTVVQEIFDNFPD